MDTEINDATAAENRPVWDSELATEAMGIGDRDSQR